MNTEMENIIEEIKNTNAKGNPELMDYTNQVCKYNEDVKKWDSTIIEDFLKHKCIASTGQSRFTNVNLEKLKGKTSWDQIEECITAIKNKYNSQENIEDACISFQQKIEQLIGHSQNKPILAIRAMINSLCPNYLCRIVNENYLDELYEYIKFHNGENLGNWTDVEHIWGKYTSEKRREIRKKNKSDLEKNEYKKEYAWYYKSHAIANFFNTTLKENDIELEKAYCYPWDFYENVIKMKNYVQKVKQQKNIILTGAPGTGKTYLANQIAEKIISEKLSECEEKNKQEYRKTHIKFVQFHPSYDYTDFVEGLRPKKGEVGTFIRVDGTFKAFCKKAVERIKEEKEEKEENFVFIIDEINRGEISKILGELFFSIDPGYRVEKGKIKLFLANSGELKKDEDFIRVDTQYQNLIEEDNDVFKDGFYVPENVYIIGTMNDIDRSVESMDFAFRRRFAFHEITAEDSENIINSLNKETTNKVEGNEEVEETKKRAEKCYEIKKKMRHLNEALVCEKCGLTTAYQIGGAYFLKLKDVDFKYDRLWNEYLYGVLYEYFRGEPDAEEKLAVLKEAFDRED